ncbi:MAG: alternative ribosome rescue aminoacyl-tRNA hydrolase ArfB [Phycisphaerales bacterium]|jgi:ribosome-associated protein
MAAAPLTNSAPDDSGSGVRLAPGIEIAEGLLHFQFASSAGPGGQNVNKRATKAQLWVAMDDLPLPAPVKHRLAALAGSHLLDNGTLQFASGQFRSQGQNKDACLEMLCELVRHALVRPKVRRPTKPSRGAKERRIKAKKHRGSIKQARRPEDD